MRFGAGLAAVLAMLAVVAPAGAAEGPSFDCRQAVSAIDRAICADPAIAAADRDLAARYAAALGKLHSEVERAVLRESQIAWMERRNRGCAAPTPPLTRPACLRQFYAERLAALEDWGKPSLPATAMVDDGLARGYGSQRPNLVFGALAAFSPDGRLFGFTTGLSDAPQVAWIYDLAARRLAAATGIPSGGATATLEAFYWVDRTLYVSGQRAVANGASVAFQLAAGPQGSVPVAVLPPSPALPGAVEDTTTANASGGERSLETERFEVAVRGLGHGAFTLVARDKQAGDAEWVIERGGWGLTGFLFDAPRARVLYQDGSGGLDVVDLALRKTRHFVVPLHSILAISPDGGVLAVVGACGGEAAPGVCFVNLSGARNSVASSDWRR